MSGTSDTLCLQESEQEGIEKAARILARKPGAWASSMRPENVKKHCKSPGCDQKTGHSGVTGSLGLVVNL